VTPAARTLAAGALVVLVASASRAAPSGDALLQRSEQAERTHSYRGVRVIRTFFRDQVVEAQARVLHEKPATTRTEYVSPPSVAGTVILQIGADRWRRIGRDAPWQRMAAVDIARIPLH
jgi:outer membrane lipoprotein-sorting protein